MIRCTIKHYYPVVAMLLASLTLTATSCAKARLAAEDAVKRAEVIGVELRERKISRDMLLSYRLHMHQANELFKKKKYKKAMQEADAAVAAARSAIERRDALEANVQEKLKEMWFLIEHDPFPGRTVVEMCFAAQEAADAGKLERAVKILLQAENRLSMQIKMTRGRKIIIQATNEYYKKNRFIPIYAKMDASGSAGDVVAEITDATDAKFIESKWLSPDTRYVKVSVNIDGGYVTGWVNGRFVF